MEYVVIELDNVGKGLTKFDSKKLLFDFFKIKATQEGNDIFDTNSFDDFYAIFELDSGKWLSANDIAKESRDWVMK